MTKEQLLQKYEKMRFDNWEMNEIETAVENGLTEEEIDIFAKLEFDWTQMKEIRLLLEFNATLEHKYSLKDFDFITQNFDYFQIEQIRLGFENGLTLDKIKIYTTQNFNYFQMEQIRLALESHLTPEQIEFIVNLKNSDDMYLARICYEKNISQNDIDDLMNKGFKWNQTQEIRLGLENGLTIDEVKIYAKPEYDAQKMYERRCALEKINKEIKKYELLENYRSLGFSTEQLKEIEIAIDDNLTVDKINIFANLNYNENQMRVIREGIMLNIDVFIYANPDFSEQQMEQVLLGLKAGIDVSTYAKIEISATEMSYIREALESGILSEKALLYAKKRYNYEISLEKNVNIPLLDARLQKYADMGMEEWQLDAIKKGLDEGRDVSIYAKTIYDANQMFAILDALRANLTNAQIEFIANSDNTWPEMNLITMCYIKDVPQNEINEFLKYNNHDINDFSSFNSNIPFIITDCLKEDFTTDQIKLLVSHDYDSEQRDELKKGFKSNLSQEQMKYLSNPDLEFDEMKLVRLCYENHVSQNEMEELLNTEFDWYQLDEVNLGLEHGLTLDKIKIYANTKYEAKQMKEIRLGLETGLTPDEINIFANPDISSLKMKDMREDLELQHMDNLSLNELIEKNKVTKENTHKEYPIDKNKKTGDEQYL